MVKAYLEPNEVIKLEKAATNLRDRLLICLLHHLGCRITEALSLRVEDVDFINGTVTIVHLKSRVKLSCPNCNTRLNKSSTYCPGCGSKVTKAVAEEMENRRQRSLPIKAETLNLLKEYIERGGPVTKEGKPLIFGINRHRAWQIVKKCAKKAGLPNSPIRKQAKYTTSALINYGTPLLLMP